MFEEKPKPSTNFSIKKLYVLKNKIFHMVFVLKRKSLALTRIISPKSKTITYGKLYLKISFSFKFFKYSVQSKITLNKTLKLNKMHILN